jgi:isorenieratene synthase
MSESTNPPLSPPVSRRTALKFLGVGAAGGMLGYSRFSKPEPAVFQQDTLDLPRMLNNRKTVAVIGAGLAGLCLRTKSAGFRRDAAGQIAPTRWQNC